jgi:hypothetical protein
VRTPSSSVFVASRGVVKEYKLVTKVRKQLSGGACCFASLERSYNLGDFYGW